MTTPTSPRPAYTERVGVPASWWIIALLVGLTTVVAMGLYLDPWLAAAVAVLAATGIAGALFWYGHQRIAVDDRGLWVGPSLLEWAFQGPAAAQDAAETRDRLGAHADVRAFVATRPYLTESVLVEVADAADPHPYWVIGTRHPQRLLAARAAGRAGAGASRG